jgi:hypothetical protein
MYFQINGEQRELKELKLDNKQLQGTVSQMLGTVALMQGTVALLQVNWEGVKHFLIKNIINLEHSGG